MNTSNCRCLQGTPTAKRFATVQAQFALHGSELVRSVRADDGRVSYIMTRAGDARHSGHWPDVEAHLCAVASASPATFATSAAGAGGDCPWWVAHRSWGHEPC